MTADAPVAAADRIPTLDVVRGLALLGVLLANMEFFRSPAFSAPELQNVGAAPVDRVASFLLAWLVEAKAYTLLAFLFGYGVALQLRRGDGAAGRVARRSVALFVLGAVHAVLLFAGDVLTLYAVVGLLALLFAGASDRVLLGCAAGFTAFEVLALTAAGLGVEPYAPDDPLVRADAAQALQRYGEGGPADAIAERLDELSLAVFTSSAIALAVLALFLVGMWAARRRALEGGVDATTWRRVLRLGLAVGLPANLLLAVLAERTDPSALTLGLAAALFLVATLPLAAAYLAAAVLGQERLRALVPAGRLALSVYLAQSLAGALVFTGYGLGLFGEVGAAAGIVLSLALFAGLLAAARWWLGRFAIGPAEWVVRSVTYGRRMRVR